MKYFTQSHEFNFQLRRKVNEKCNKQSHDRVVFDDDGRGLLKCETKARIENKSSLNTLTANDANEKRYTKQFK